MYKFGFHTVILMILLLVSGLAGKETSKPLDSMDFSLCTGKEVVSALELSEDEVPEYIYLCRILHEYLVSQKDSLEFPNPDHDAIQDRILYVAYTFFQSNPPEFDVNDYIEENLFVCPKDLYEKYLFEFFGPLAIDYAYLSREYLYDMDREMYTVYPGGYGSLQKYLIRHVKKISPDQLYIEVDLYEFIEDSAPACQLNFTVKTDEQKFRFVSVKKA